MGTFDQLFVYCGVCHRRSSKEDPLFLTSCAHILCSQHWDSKLGRNCTLCSAGDVSVVVLSDARPLPPDITVFFQPIEQTLETLYNVSQFQMTGLVNQCRFYQDHVVTLQAKCAKQRQLLFQAKNELDSIPKLKTKISELELQLRTYQKRDTPFFTSKQHFKSDRVSSMSSASERNGNSIFSNMKNHLPDPPATVDLTLDDENELEQAFVRKLKKNSNLKKSYNNPNSQIVADSTHIGNFTDDDSSSSNKKNSSQTITRELSSSKLPVQSKTQFPNALEKLRVVKRNNTVTNASSSNYSQASHGALIDHMRSSRAVNVRDFFQTQSNIPSVRRSSTSQQALSKFSNNRTTSSSSNPSGNKIRKHR
ncbi:hypothetical protein Kpol_483p18 [Vanderwaltozyma polyspora DSM 70294]|uniref:RING-type domain-containing protein n=1 Tax=Vanderwaltozyma polyspora (strain ATCC 22028 / DSM 70294 / BCRC 21397 / CBS 2163 / NBRC 10782 / NRRL Y-8283 / UCD 57-17) TaxID=436907 RepID=A7TQ70_VANPO|nr:uncharacterized protein Kpol_483p18 [Vanderwaltozyma polyspora DSM 70294]EDO15599.1 hypothetical protein Kpol_483p18 [Vanderwaltozyma polyspora DSM 70294]